MRALRLQLTPPSVSVVLLGALLVTKLCVSLWAGSSVPRDANLRQSVASIPYSVGDWVGTDVDFRAAGRGEQGTSRVLLHRRFAPLKDGGRIELRVVGGRRPSDLWMEAPPYRYRALGWRLVGSRPRGWRVGTGTEYEFVGDDPQRGLELVVHHFRLPGAERPGANGNAAEVQLDLVLIDVLPESQRDTIVESFLAAGEELWRTSNATQPSDPAPNDARSPRP